MNKIIPFLLLIIAVMFIIFLIRKPGYNNPPPPPAKPSQETPSGYLYHWRGIGSRNTESFIIKSSPWQIVWVFKPKEQLLSGLNANMFIVTIYQTNQEFYREQAVDITNATELKSGTYEVQTKGEVYLQINSMQGSWDIKILANDQHQ